MPIFTNRKDNLEQKDTKGRPSNGLSSKIHLKVGGYTHWVHLRCTPWIIIPSQDSAEAWDRIKDKAGPQPKCRSTNGNNFW
jgi:hypothetical protein